jgi:hypothetical protein
VWGQTCVSAPTHARDYPIWRYPDFQHLIQSFSLTFAALPSLLDAKGNDASFGARRPCYLSAAFCACGAGWLACLALPRNEFCPCREKLIDSPRIRAASCGAWNPVEFSASTKSR